MTELYQTTYSSYIQIWYNTVLSAIYRNKYSMHIVHMILLYTVVNKNNLYFKSLIFAE